MKRFIVLFVLILLLLGCDDRTTNLDEAKYAWLHVYYTDNLIYEEKLDENDDLQSEILNLPDNSQVTLDKFVNIHYNIPPDEEEISRSYVVWAKRADYFTQFTTGSYLDTLQINASSGFTPVISGKVCGTIYTTHHFPVSNLEFYILQDSVIVDSIVTSVNGYFDLDLAFGNYQIGVKGINFQPSQIVDFIVNSYYDDYIVLQEDEVEKPNIYIYPQEQMKLDININFPHGGEVTTSIPNYGNGWKNLNINPSGKINDEFTFLFYESNNPDLSQYNKGWVIAQDDLESFFTQNLTETGFARQEIVDFTDYWIPLLTEFPFYAIYPQYNEQLNRMIELEFSVKPDNLLRLVYAIEELQDDTLILEVSEIPAFERNGFFVVEWGVSLRPETMLTLN